MAATASYDEGKDGHGGSSSAVLQRLAESTSDILEAEYNLSKARNTTEDLASSQCLGAGTSAMSISDEVNGGFSTQDSETSLSNDMLLDELFEDCVQVSVRDTQHTTIPRSLSIIEEEQPTPALSEASGLSTKASNSIHKNSISSFGSGSDNVHLLMDVDNEDTWRLPMHNEECIRGTRMQSPGPFLEESIAHLSRVYKSTRSYLPSKVLSKILQYRTKESITVADLKQITSIADFLSAARSDRDACRLYRFLFDRIMAQTDSSLSTLDIYRAGINVTRTATLAENHKEIAELMKNIMSKRDDFISPSTVEACLLHSHLGNNFRARNELQAAERHCRRGFDCYQRYHRSSNMHASQMILATNFFLVREAKGELFNAYPNPYFSITSTLRIAIEDTLLAMLQWCNEAIVEDDPQALAELIHGCSDELWTHGSANDLSDFETTLLFCHLWKRWRLAGEGSQMSTQHRNCHSLLAKLEKDLGIAPVDALAAFSIMIMSVGEWEHHFDRRKPTSIRRILLTSQAALAKDHNRLYFDFLDAHTAPLKTKFKRFSTDTYTTMVEEFIQGFADLHLHLHLSEAAFQDPRLRVRPNRSSMTPSMTPTTLSTPRSSWSGYASFKLASQRAKSAWSQIGSDAQSVTSGPQRPSTSSSSLRHRLSLSGSFNSFRTSRSSSFMNADPDDVIMEDVIWA
jgi:hypothetical protein